MRKRKNKMGAKYNESQANAAKSYRSKFDRINIYVPKGQKDFYKKVASENGKSLNQFIVDCIENNIKYKNTL